MINKKYINFFFSITFFILFFMLYEGLKNHFTYLGMIGMMNNSIVVQRLFACFNALIQSCFITGVSLHIFLINWGKQNV